MFGPVSPRNMRKPKSVYVASPMRSSNAYPFPVLCPPISSACVAALTEELPIYTTPDNAPPATVVQPTVPDVSVAASTCPTAGAVGRLNCNVPTVAILKFPLSTRNVVVPTPPSPVLVELLVKITNLVPTASLPILNAV